MNFKRQIPYCFSFIFLLVFLFFSQNIKSQYLNFNNYSVIDGLAQSQVFDLTEDHKGYIWMATQGGGVSRFNGSSFTNFKITDGLYSNYVNALCLDEKKRLWLGTGKGLNVFTDSIYKVPQAKELEVFCVKEWEGRIYAGTNSGLYVYKEDSLVALDAKFNSSCYDLKVFNERMYVASGKGVFSTDGNEVVPEAPSNFRITSLLAYKNSLLVGTYGDGLRVLRSGSLKKATISQSIYGNVILALAQDQQGKLWIGTQMFGVYAFENDLKYEHFDVSKGLSNNHIRVIYQDSWNNIWIGTSGGGASKYNGALFSHFNKENGLNGNFIYDVLVDKKKRVWVSTSGLGVNVMTDSSVTVLDASNHFYDAKVRSLFEDSRGNIWLGTEGNGVSVLPNQYNHTDTLIHYSRKDGLSAQWVRAFAELDSVIYIGTAGGGITRAYPLKGTDTDRFYFETLKLKAGKFPKRINDLAVDHKKRLWLASENNGLFFLRSGMLHKVNMPDQNITPRSLLVKDKVLWIGTAENGLFYCVLDQFEVKVKPFPKNNELLSLNVYLLQNGVGDDFWMGTEKGVNQIFSTPSGDYDIVSFGATEGFTGVETCRNASFSEPDGKIWFGTINGLTVYNPVETYYSYIPPKLHVKDVKLFYESFAKTKYGPKIKQSYWIDGFELNYDENHISFEFDGIDQSQPLEVEYSYQLVGYEKEWSPWSKRDIATYSNLSPGKYTFKLRTKGYSGAIRENDPITFEILPPFWKTTSFIIISTLIVVLILFFVLWRIYSRIKSKNKREREALIKDKTILELEQKALRLQMNPHFIFHILNAIRQDYRSGKKEAEQHLIGFSKLMRQVLEQSRKSKVSIEEELDTLELYLQLQQQSGGRSFDYEIRVEDDLEVDVPVLPPLLLQPFVENSIIHGFNGLDKKGKISIHFSVEIQQLIITLKDNGIGRSAALEKQHQKELTHKSAALEITQQRLSMLNGDQQNTTLKIEDIKENGNVLGTKVRIGIPFIDYSTGG